MYCSNSFASFGTDEPSVALSGNTCILLISLKADTGGYGTEETVASETTPTGGLQATTTKSTSLIWSLVPMRNGRESLCS
mmetsp:Transcript_1494/g.2863  ORF Transcript_1494/g.2863 Transcript_1494/m.2863 type:complete len:80 (-) Transcript_1494:346-585(-)